ncbi:hypothetical protein [Ralstonia phage RSP15]|uniref:hypothetical protein n=1 Tax=Ralstonia phage RSP15 TaxID=1785960 RepID=UPI00074D399A|nr:hypothetical protein BH754_gp190 [Ralstonia phage RSP15]BAU40116.1 hypothetical protein [Ralstonia phage RSP15]
MYFGRNPQDSDIICTFEDFQEFIKILKNDDTVNIKACYPFKDGEKYVIKTEDNEGPCIYEVEIAWPGSTAEKLLYLAKCDPHTKRFDTLGFTQWIPSLNFLYMLKMSHRYLKNNPHFLKTMQDIKMMREKGARIQDEHMPVFKEREAATYKYKHPNLNTTKKDFFNTPGVEYTYEHDDIHKAIKHLKYPAYEYYKPDTNEVYCSQELFEKSPEHIKLLGVLEEVYVLALERSQIPYPDTDRRESLLIALEKVCTSITSGWFREYAWENYDKVKELFNENYVDRFWQAVKEGKVRKYGQ